MEVLIKNIFNFFILFSTLNCFSQSLEEQIYNTTEYYFNQQNTVSLDELDDKIQYFETRLNTTDDYFAFVNLIVNKAYYLGEKNLLKDAILSYEKAQLIYVDNNVLSYDIVEYCLIPLGILYHKTNAYIKAENIILYYIGLAKKQGNLQQQILGGINLAILYQSLNKHNSVIDIVNNTLTINGLKETQKKRLNSIKQQSIILMKEETKINDNLVFNDLKDEDVLKLKYQLALKEKDYDHAYEYLTLLKDITFKNKNTTKRELAKLSFQNAQLQFLLKNPEKALLELNNSLTILIPNFKTSKRLDVNDLYPENLFIDVFDLKAAIETNPEDKLYFYDLSAHVSSLLDDEAVSEENFIIKSRSNRIRSEKCIAILYEFYKDKKDTISLERALNYAEQYKVSILKKSFKRKDLLQRFGTTDTTLIKEDLLIKEQKKLTHLLLNTHNLKTSGLKQDSIRSRITAINIALKGLQKTIDNKYKVDAHQYISLGNIKSILKQQNTSIVEYFYGNNAIYQFIFSEEEYGFSKIPINPSITKDITKFIDYFNSSETINENLQSYTKDAFSIYQLLNFKALSKTSKIVIIPDGLINFIPFEALLNSNTTSSSFSEMPFLVKSHTLSYNSSLLFYLKNKRQRLENTLLGVFPVFKNSGKELLHTIDEAKSIEEHISSTLLIDSLATKENFLNAINNYSILHVSSHATSGDFITPASISFYKDSLSLNQIYELDIKPNLVVLSACETGIGKLWKGEGTMSISSGFQYAGAENILFSLWQINDLSTSKIMSSFYEYYGNGQNAMFANKQAKINYLENPNISNAKKSPYYWSAFIFYGDTPELKSQEHIIYI